MIDKLLKNENMQVFLMSAIVGLICYILVTQINHGKEITELKSSVYYRSQQLDRIETAQTDTINKLDSLKELVLRNIHVDIRTKNRESA